MRHLSQNSVMDPLKLIGGLVVAEVGVGDASPVACGYVDQRDWPPLNRSRLTPLEAPDRRHDGAALELIDLGVF